VHVPLQHALPLPHALPKLRQFPPSRDVLPSLVPGAPSPRVVASVAAASAPPAVLPEPPHPEKPAAAQLTPTKITVMLAIRFDRRIAPPLICRFERAHCGLLVHDQLYRGRTAIRLAALQKVGARACP
jgi:hypothetical protein